MTKMNLNRDELYTLHGLTTAQYEEYRDLVYGTKREFRREFTLASWNLRHLAAKLDKELTR